MKTLVVFYSRSGITKKVALEIAKNIQADTEEIIDLKNRSGTIGHIKSLKDGITNKLTKIKKTKKDLRKYDLIILGTPVWCFTMSCAIRTYIQANKKYFKKIAIFCTFGGSGDKKTISDIANLCKKKSLASLCLKRNEIERNKHNKDIKEFCKKLKKLK